MLLDFNQIDVRSWAFCRYRYDMPVEEAAELARRAIYHATFRDGASGGVASGTSSLPHSLFLNLRPSISFMTCI